ncbi:MAG TPA: putative Ig domain-containing protein, partial [Candidatus Dormibacteraeota bacterium]|nr:putative Ig domain-containing protein [Candidatus Dormibacteraeota bacterium]
VNFKLDKGGEAIGLFGADGTSMDFVSFNAQTSDVSQGRYPDGGPLVYFLPAATPGTNNVFLNSSPSLSAITNRFVILGQNVSFTATATDTDAPPQLLTFSLVNGIPAGATVQAGTGVFNWSPASAPSTNTLSLVVSDNGTPAMTATQTFLVTVALPPQLNPSPVMNGNQMIFSFPTWSGITYQLEYKDDLAYPAWTPLGSSIPGTGAVIHLTNNVGSAQRYFRLRILP